MQNPLRFARKVAQLTQEQLAARVGVTIAVISRLEKELDEETPRFCVTYRTAVRVARAVNLNPQELFPVADYNESDDGPKRRGRPSVRHRQAKASPRKELARVG